TASAGVVPLAFERSPMLKAGLIGALVSGVVGTLVNDSGIAVLSMVLALAVPLVLAAGIGTLQEAGRLTPLGDAGRPSSGPSGPSGDSGDPSGGSPGAPPPDPPKGPADGTGLTGRVPGFA